MEREESLVINISTSGLEEVRNELKEIRSLAKKTGTAVSSVAGKAKHLGEVMNRECPDNDDMLLALRRFAVRVAEDEKATPDQLEAMVEAAHVVLSFS